MKRICIIAQSHYATDPRVRREVRALVGAGYDVDVICLCGSDEPREQVTDGATIYGIPLDRKRGGKARYVFEYGAFTVIAGWRALRRMLQRPYNVVQVCNLPDVLILAALVPKILGAKVLFDAHDGTPEALMIHKGLRSGSLWVRFATWMERLAFAMADEVVTVHEVMKQHFVQRGANADKISIVMNLPDRELFCRRPLHYKERRDTHFTLMYAGSITRPYGLQTAIRALPLLADIPELKLRFIGPGNYKAELAKLAEDLGVIGQVSFEPPVPHDQIADLYQEADVGISPHTGGAFGEICFSNKVTEYLACGLPAVVSRTPVYEHYYDDWQLAFCDPDDPESFAEKVRAIYRDPEYARRLRMSGIQRAGELNWEKERGRYLEIVDRLAA